MRLASFIIFFLLLGAFFIISENKLYITNSEDLSILKQKYSEWVSNVFDNSVNLVGNVVGLDWLPKE